MGYIPGTSSLYSLSTYYFGFFFTDASYNLELDLDDFFERVDL